MAGSHGQAWQAQRARYAESDEQLSLSCCSHVQRSPRMQTKVWAFSLQTAGRHSRFLNRKCLDKKRRGKMERSTSRSILKGRKTKEGSILNVRSISKENFLRDFHGFTTLCKNRHRDETKE